MAFNLKQVSAITNEVAKMSWGEEAVANLNLTDTVALGNKVMSSETDRDLFTGNLVNRIGKTIISNRIYNANIKGIVKHPMEYGAILQKVVVQPFDAEDSEAWKPIHNGDQLDYLGKVHIPETIQYLFENRDVYEFSVTIPHDRINTAFINESTKMAFIAEIYNQIEASVKVAEENWINLAIANFIGEKLYAKSQSTPGVHAVDMLKEYNDAYGLNLTPEQALRTADFYKMVVRSILIYKKRMGMMGSLFNTKGLKRFTPEENLRILLLSDFISGAAVYLQADTYHKELVALPGYTEVAYWQGQGLDSKTASASTVDITTSSGHQVKQDYIIGVMFDEQALGVLYNMENAISIPAPRQRLTQYCYQIDKGYFNDLSENGLVLYMGTQGA